MALELTIDEIVETLKRSDLTTVLVEGKDDVMIYRWVEEELGIHNASFLPCGGRSNLLQVYKRRSEFSNLKTIFVADKDTFVYNNPPEEYSEIIWTNGYSIENDLYYGRRIEQLLSQEEKVVFLKSLNSFINYYAFEIDNYLNGKEFCFRKHPQHLLCETTHLIKEEILKEIGFIQPNEGTINKLTENYDVLIRGKSMFALLTRILSDSKREIKHSKPSLLEHCYRTHRSEKFTELLGKINKKICA